MAPLASLFAAGLSLVGVAPGSTPLREVLPVVAMAPGAAAAPKAGASDAKTASYFLGLVEAYYAGTKDLSADFRQTVTDPVYGSKDVHQGSLKVKKPAMMIWDYAQAADADFYADGDTLWVVEAQTRTVVSKRVKDSDFASAVQFLFGGRRLLEDFKVRHARGKEATAYAKKDHHVVELAPKQSNPHYKRIFLVIDDASGRVDAFAIRGGDDGVNYFELSNVRRNPGLRADAFAYRPPVGWSVTRE